VKHSAPRSRPTHKAYKPVLEQLETRTLLNSAPIASSDTYTTLHDHGFNTYYSNFASILANDSDADNDILIPSVVGSGPSHGILEAFDPSNGHLQYVPNPGFYGADSF
jgi:hypothetical protein